jgi:hypothetical protein
MKSRGRPLSVMAHLKTSVLKVQATDNFLAHAIIIEIAKLKNDPNYKEYRKGRKIRPVVQKLLAETGISLTEGVGIPQLIKFQEHFRQYKRTVYHVLACEDLIRSGSVYLTMLV